MGGENFTKKNALSFRRRVWRYYREHGRRLPWRPPALKLRKDGTLNAYKVLVSEIMLQQTQVDRVIPKYKAFLKVFPTVKTLAEAPLRDILCAWQGLGYNRRAKALKKLAEIVMREHGGAVPRSFMELKALPGIGEYTARAVRTFALNEPEVFIETNIRAVFIHFFFNKKNAVSDNDIFSLIAQTLPIRNPREWYYALMDYGAMLKSHYPNPNRKNRGYARQSPFKDSERRIRGLIIKKLLIGPRTGVSLAREIQEPLARIEKNASALIAEGFVKKKGNRILLA